jgi:serpin B
MPCLSLRSPSVHRRRLVAGLVAAVLVVAACGSGDDADATTDDGGGGGVDRGGGGGGELVKADVARSTPAADAPVDAVVGGLDDFAVRLAAQSPDGNLVVSPASIGVAFAMAEAGADEATAAKIADVFGFPDQPGVHEAMNALSRQLDGANGDTEQGEVILELANALWAQQGTEIGQPFLDTLAANYGAGVQPTDFAGDPEGSRSAINGWVSDRTRERIPDLVPEGMITAETVTMLVNAIYMKAPWAVPFSEETTDDQPFHLADGSTATVPTMHGAERHWAAAQTGGFTAVELPYAGGKLSMVVLLPDEGTALADAEASLTGTELEQIVGGLQPATVDLDMPRWEAESALDLGQSLTALGLPIPGGDLSGIAPGTQIGGAVHAANITVDEKGTEAAAATAVMGATSAMPPDQILHVTIDRPFLFLVRDTASGAPLFYGRITDPQG